MHNLAVAREKLADYPELLKLSRELLRVQGRSWGTDTRYLPSTERKKLHDDLESAISALSSYLDGIMVSSPDIDVNHLRELARRVVISDSQRRKRLTKRLKEMFSRGECVFLTLTFRDDVLESTSFETRRRYVTRYLQSQSTDFVANVDFGGKNGREHYHCVVLTSRVDCKPWVDSYGGTKVKKILTSDKSARKLSSYITKLVGHAYKASTTSSFSLVYSRSKKEKFVSVPEDELPF